MRNKILLVFILIFIISIVGWWAVRYLALFQKPISSGESVILHQFSQNAEPSTESLQPVDYQVEEVVSGLYVPWSIVFTRPLTSSAQERMLVTERNGKVRVIEGDQLKPEPLYIFDEVSSQGEEGLMGMTLDPQYDSNHFIYFCYAYPNGSGLSDKVVRLTDTIDSLTDQVTIIDNIPAATNHAGCRIKFGPDDKLYITTGDASRKQLAQDLNSLGGKILRVNADGSIPEDNPFPHSPIYSYGHRNSQGIAWHPETHQLFATEHGPSVFDGPAGGDEINLIEKGQNYGWPVVSHDQSHEGMIDPLITFTPAVAPASALFYDGRVFPQWTNAFFFGGLRGEGLFRVEIQNQQVVRYEKLSKVDVGRIREVIEGSDGMVYFTTSNRDGRGTLRENDDKIYRLIPEK